MRASAFCVLFLLIPAVPVLVREPELLGQHVGIDANSLGVAARPAVVRLEGRGERQDRRGAGRFP